MAGGIREDIARFSVYIVRILAYVVRSADSGL